MDKREQILNALTKWVRQRPGLEFGNYGDVASYRSEQRRIRGQLHDFNALLNATRWRESIGEAELQTAFKDAYAGRLCCFVGEDWPPLPPYSSIAYTCGCGLYVHPQNPLRKAAALHIDDCPLKPAATVRLEYCTGQYWPTEYRAAACAVLASALWAYWREQCPEFERDEAGGYVGLSPGSWVRNKAADELGVPLARRWMDFDNRAAAERKRYQRVKNRKTA